MASSNRRPTRRPYERPGSRRPRPRPRTGPAGPWLNGPIPVIGVVGGIGSGKSTVAAAFALAGGFVIDADTVGHALLDQRPVRERVVARFGPGVVTRTVDEAGVETESIDRQTLGATVFSSPTLLADLETILHPRMRETFQKAIARTVRKGLARAVVLDAAILYEAGWETLCDRVVFVDSPKAIRQARVKASRGWAPEVLEAREAVQGDLERKKATADVVLPNPGNDAVALAAAAKQAWERLLVPPPRKPRPADD